MLKAKTLLEFQLDSKKEAEAIYRALSLEASSSPSDRARASFDLSGEKVSLKIDAADAASLLASINSYLRWISLSYSLTKEVANGKIVPAA